MQHGKSHSAIRDDQPNAVRDRPGRLAPRLSGRSGCAVHGVCSAKGGGILLGFDLQAQAPTSPLTGSLAIGALSRASTRQCEPAKIASPPSSPSTIDKWLVDSGADDLADWVHADSAHARDQTSREAISHLKRDGQQNATRILARATEATAWLLYTGGRAGLIVAGCADRCHRGHLVRRSAIFDRLRRLRMIGLANVLQFLWTDVSKRADR